MYKYKCTRLDWGQLWTISITGQKGDTVRDSKSSIKQFRLNLFSFSVTTIFNVKNKYWPKNYNTLTK